MKTRTAIVLLAGILALPMSVSASSIVLTFQVQYVSQTDLATNTSSPFSTTPFVLVVTIDNTPPTITHSTNGTTTNIYAGAFSGTTISNSPLTANLLTLATSNGLPAPTPGPAHFQMNNLFYGTPGYTVVSTQIQSSSQGTGRGPVDLRYLHYISLFLQQTGVFPTFDSVTPPSLEQVIALVGTTSSFSEFSGIQQRDPQTGAFLGHVPGSVQYVGRATLLSVTTPQPIPEPGTLALFGTGLLSVAGMLRRRIR
jgi:hypothetical protein